MPGWRKVNFITVTRRPHHPNIAAGLYCLATSPGFLPTLCEKWSGFFYVHRVFLYYTRDRRLRVSSERLGNEDKAPCPRALLPGRASNRGPPVWKSEALTALTPRLIIMIIIRIIVTNNNNDNNDNDNIGNLYCTVPILIYSTAHYNITYTLLPRL